jgi:ATP-dependent DNA helicase RecG
MDPRELDELLLDLESDRSERTSSTANIDKLGEAICAFANDLANHGKPGYLFVGATDEGSASGTRITDRLLQVLGGIRTDGNLLPAPTVSVARHTLGGGDMAVIEVLPSDLPPVRYKGTVWVRVGPRRCRATEADERRLSEKRASSARSWDARPCNGASLDDLMLALFESYKLEAIARDVLEENHRDQIEQLSSLRFLDLRSNRPTNAAVILFGKDALNFVPGAYVQYVHYAGKDAASEVERERKIDGDLLTILRELASIADEVARARPESIDALREVIVYDYPPTALREVLVNAVIHRDYESNTPVMISHFEDRIEILNPGGLHGDMRVEDFPGPTAYRNPLLAEAAKHLGFVNRFGRGVPRTQDALAKNGSPPADFDPRERHFLVTLRIRP